MFVKSNINVTRKLDFEKSDIHLSIESDIEYTTRLASCAKEPEMITWFEKFFKEGDVFYDIGANIGAYSLVAAILFKGKIKGAYQIGETRYLSNGTAEITMEVNVKDVF